MFSTFREIFSVDLRSLALFRVGIGSIILLDLIHRSQDIEEHYTDLGTLPISSLSALQMLQSPLHTLSGSYSFQLILFILTGICALAFTLGYKTRWTSILMWCLLHSMMYRNPDISYGGDTYISALLFWGMFVPLGARYSIDAAMDTHDEPLPDRYFSTSSFAVVVQVTLIYFFSGYLKTGSSWLDGTAVYYALQNDLRGTALGEWIIQFPKLTAFLTWHVRTIELLAPLFFLSPFFHLYLRSIGMSLLLMMHFGFILFMKLAFFPYICFFTLSLLIPTAIWDKLQHRLNTKERKSIKIYYDTDCGFCVKTCLLLRTFLLLPRTLLVAPASSEPAIQKTLEQHNSWVVVDSEGTKHIRGEALVWLISQSPIFWPIGKLFSLQFFQPIHEGFYGLIAKNRKRLAYLSSFFLKRKAISTYKISAPLSMAIVLLLISATLQSVFQAHPNSLGSEVATLNRTLGINQKWGFFSPNPGQTNGWYIISGELYNNEIVDVYNLRKSPPDWETPADLESVYKNFRWKKYLAHGIS